MSSLYCIEAVLILDQKGNRVYANYFAPPHVQDGEESLAGSLKRQREFELEFARRTAKSEGDLQMFSGSLVRFKRFTDVVVVVVGHASANEVLVDVVFEGIAGALELLLDSGGVDMRVVQDKFDLVCLLVDEAVDNGIVLETDPATIAARVTRPPTTDPQVSLDLDKGLLGAWGFAKSKLQERLQQGR
ncbi:coatomer subunit zeta KNAG_0D02530 [Huiozyma naganishii CBS 8797]|uniref:Coatomer subunit zeta n=1 Tax=Huiozyma naganishii (strain ATCC MYA-139 / BCRC 22969 / CBS 8797 / KCTC 17520 / NBRC 10181 / NCYC 3082 / Yp74L-3) TaxID=1071383 RepID=J7RY21_HUIN7|nr:hypothetical protein KNAG_0D02530 [Kazachstania naganishii CBS 8797]CCK70002.1 hypothetical protein KNAG_0D02530 [Kazachstania naganishii CBS 8797]